MRHEHKRREDIYAPGNESIFDVEVPDELASGGDVEALLAWIWKNSVGPNGKGSKGSHRAGIYEIQLDVGTWDNETGCRLNRSNAHFTPWED